GGQRGQQVFADVPLDERVQVPAPERQVLHHGPVQGAALLAQDRQRRLVEVHPRPIRGFAPPGSAWPRSARPPTSRGWRTARWPGSTRHTTFHPWALPATRRIRRSPPLPPTQIGGPPGRTGRGWLMASRSWTVRPSNEAGPSANSAATAVTVSSRIVNRSPT